MLRKSSESPPETCRRFQFLPRSLEKRITPLEPLPHTAMCSSPIASTELVALTPRRLVSTPVVCTDQVTSSDVGDGRVMARGSLIERRPGETRTVAPHRIATASEAGIRKRMPRILAFRVRGPPTLRLCVCGFCFFSFRNFCGDVDAVLGRVEALLAVHFLHDFAHAAADSGCEASRGNDRFAGRRARAA